MTEYLTGLLKDLGPWIVFLVALTETAVFIGLLIPAEATILVAAFLASQGYFNVWIVLAATFFGGFAGDQTGYLFGRYGGARLVAGNGRIARIWRRTEPRAARLFQSHASLSVTLARFISFVRTLMPWFAGMTRMPYGRFILYDFFGVLGWAGASVAAGYVAGESWEAAAGVLGRTTAIVVGVVVFIALAGYVVKRRRADPDVLPPVTRVALTGNAASGKSAVVEVWRSLGANIIDADVLAREAVERGSEGHLAVVTAFGEEILAPDGSIDRARLRAIVFGDAEERARLEAIVHPEVARLRAEQERAFARRGATLVVSDIPLLYETGLDAEFDLTVLVHADDDVRLDRLVRLRGIPESEARALMAAQMPSAEKRARAHVVIENNGSLAELSRRAAEVWQEVQAWRKPSA